LLLLFLFCIFAAEIQPFYKGKNTIILSIIKTLTIKTISMEVTDNEFSRQYQVKIEGELAYIEYSLQDRKIFFTKTQLPETITEAVIDEFFKNTLALVAQKKYKIVPVCPVAISFFRRNKEYKEVLSAGIRV
jgi:hypothetical protein